MGEAKLKWSGKSHGGYWGNLTFAVLLRAGMLPAYLLLFFVAAFFTLFLNHCLVQYDYLYNGETNEQ